MALVFCTPASTTMKLAIMITLEFVNPANASGTVDKPVTTNSIQARRGGAPKGSTSNMISPIMITSIARARIIWIVISFSSFSLDLG